MVAAGKAAGTMARAAEELLGEKVSGGLVVTKDGHDPGPEDFETVFASHPEPDERGVEAARKCRSCRVVWERGICCWRSSRVVRRRCSPTRAAHRAGRSERADV